MTKQLKSGMAYALPLAKGYSFALLGMLFAPLKSHADIAQGGTWLKTNINAPSPIAVDAQALAESVSTLSKLNVATGTLELNALLQDEHSTEILSRVALLASLRGQSPSIYFSELKASQNDDGGFGHLEGWQSNPLDTAFVLLALSETQFIQNLLSATEKQQWLDIQYKALGYLKSQQRSDGSYQVLSLDKLYVSAYVLNALSKNIPARADITPNVINLVNYLEQAKIAPAQWSTGTQGLFIDALVAEALHPFHADGPQTTETAFRQRALDAQQANGSWSSDPYTTALVLRSLTVQAAAAVNPVTSGIRLQVIDAETGLPVSGVSLSSSTPPLNQSSDINGHIIINSAPAGQVRFSLQRAGYAGIQFDITLRQGEQLNLGQVKLSRASNTTTARIQGKVLDATTGAAVAGAQVTVVLVDSNGQPLANTAPQIVLTAGDGSYLVTLGQGGAFGIDIRKDGYTPVQGNGSVPNSNITIFSPRLTPVNSNVASAHGKVVDDNGQPLGGVSVVENGVAIATTDLQGLFSISGVQAGSKQWQLSKQGYLQATVSLSLQAGQNINMGVIRLPVQPGTTEPGDPQPQEPQPVPTGTLNLRLLSTGGSLVQGLVINAELLDANNNVLQRQSFTADVNTAAIAPLKLSAGKWRITAVHPSYFSSSWNFNVAANQIINFETYLTLKSYHVAGRVLDSSSGLPIANALVSIYDAFNNRFLYATKSDQNGFFNTTSNNSGFIQRELRVEVGSPAYAPTSRLYQRDLAGELLLDTGELRLRPKTAIVGLPDLKVESLNTSNIVSNTQTLAITGTLGATLINDSKVDLLLSNYTAVAFEDANYNRVFDDGEKVFGSVTIDRNIPAAGTVSLTIPVSGVVRFRDAPIAVMIDASKKIPEKIENNNVKLTSDPLVETTKGTLDFEEVWHFKTTNQYPNGMPDVFSFVPVVAGPLLDTNHDGKIGRGDIASIIYSSGNVLSAINGATGNENWTASGSFSTLYSSAIADLDGDGVPEVIATGTAFNPALNRTQTAIKILSNTGQLLKNAFIDDEGYRTHVVLSDLNADGRPEILAGNTVFDYQGNKIRSSTLRSVMTTADLNNDGLQEVIREKGVEDAQGNLLFRFPEDGCALIVAHPPCFEAVADLNNDKIPEIILVGRGKIHIHSATGALLARYSVSTSSSNGGPPTVADFDGDGVPDIGVASARTYSVFRADGSVLWSKEIQDTSSSYTGSTLFDFNNDGLFEVVYADEQYLRVYNAIDGAELIKLKNTSGTAYERPIVLDADADGHADILFIGGGKGQPIPDDPQFTSYGLRMISSRNRDWVNTRNIWNQYSYHVTNVNDDLTIPATPLKSWEAHNTYIANLPITDETNQDSIDLTASYLRFSDNGMFSPSTLTARIGNAGSKTAPAGTPVSFYRVPPAVNGTPSQPVLIKTVTLSEPLLPGHYQDMTVEYAGDMSGFGELVVVANDAGAGLESLTGIPVNAPNNGGVVQEYTRANNLARLAFGSGFQNYSLHGLIDKGSYKAGESVQITAIPTNLGSLSSDVIVRIRIVDSAGNVVAALPEQLASLAGSMTGDGSNSKTIQVPWVIGQAHAGNYRAIIELVRDGWFGQETVASVERSFNVVSDAHSVGLTGVSVQVDRTQYSVGDTVSVTSRLQNTASNETATPRTVTLELTGPAGQVLWTQTTAYGALPPNGLVDNTYQIALAQVTPGNYQLRATSHAPDGSQANQVSTRSFTVLSAAQSGVGIAGNIQAAATVDVGSPIQFIWSISNQSNSVLNGINTRIILVDAATGNLINAAVYAGSQHVTAGGNSGQQVAEWTSAGNPEQPIMAVLQVYLDKPGLPEQERWRTLSTTAFKLTVPPLKVSFDDVQKASKPVLIYYSCYDGWQDWLSSWLLGGYDSACFSEREAQIKSYLNRIKVPYTMVKEPWQFRDRMHSGIYGQYWLLGAVEPLTPHTYKEIRETAHLGDNLMTDNGVQSHQNSNLFALAGARFRGRIQLSDGVVTPLAANAGLPALLTTPDNTELANTPLKTTTARKGQSLTANWPLLLEPISSYTQVSATFDGSKKLGITVEHCNDAGAKPNSHYQQTLSAYPAVTMAPYGRGKPVALAFDLPASLSLANGGQIPATNNLVTLPQKRWDAALTELLTPRQSVARSSYVPNEPVHIPLTLDNQSSQPRTVQLEVELPSGAQWLGREGGTQNVPASSQTQAKVTYQISLPANSKFSEVVALRLPAASGSHVVRTSVLAVVGGNVMPQALAQQENRYVVRTLDERLALLNQSMNNWNSSAGASWIELKKARAGMVLVDKFYRFGQLELAIKQAGELSDDLAAMRSAQDSRITANRIELDELMRGLQIRWYLQRNGQRPSP